MRLCVKGEGGKAPSLSEGFSPQVAGRMGQPPGSGSHLIGSAESQRRRAQGEPDRGEKPERS